jgi:predicted nucleotidyltransferase
MKERIPEHLSEILTELEQQLSARASAAYLYGSMTRRYSDTSDIDLLLVTDSDPGPVYVTPCKTAAGLPKALASTFGNNK